MSTRYPRKEPAGGQKHKGMLTSPEVSREHRRPSSPPPSSFEEGGEAFPHILVVGFNHHESSVETLEAIRDNFRRIAPKSLTEIRKDLFGPQSERNVSEFAVISTCNRFEVCAVTSDPKKLLPSLISSLLSLSSHSTFEEGRKQEEEGNYHEALVVLEDKGAVEHIFSVACGVDSLVVGDRQILSQIKKTIVRATEEGAASKILSELFLRAFRTGKTVRNSGAIPQSKDLSVGWVATELVKNKIGGIDDEEPVILLIGAGKMVVEALLSLQEDLKGRGKKISIVIANRTLERAKELARGIPSSTAIPLESVPSWLGRVDAVICATSSEKHILEAEDLRKAAHTDTRASEMNLLVVDIGMPRNVEPSARNVEGVELWNLDDLKPFVKERQKSIEESLAPVHTLIHEESEDFMNWFRVEAKAVPVVAALHKKAEAIRREEVRESLSKLPEITQKEKEVIEILSKRIVNRILSQPTEKLKELVTRGDGGSYTKAVRELFSLEDDVEF